MEYVLNYDYIKEVLCINKDQPQLQCNGKCHLNKQLQQVAESEESSDENLPELNKLEITFHYHNPVNKPSFKQLSPLLNKVSEYDRFSLKPYWPSIATPPPEHA